VLRNKTIEIYCLLEEEEDLTIHLGRINTHGKAYLNWPDGSRVDPGIRVNCLLKSIFTDLERNVCLYQRE